MIIGWQAELPAPDEEALENFRFASLSNNVSGEEVNDLSGEEEKIIIKNKSR